MEIEYNTGPMDLEQLEAMQGRAFFVALYNMGWTPADFAAEWHTETEQRKQAKGST